MSKQQPLLTRRAFLQFSAGAVSLATLAACAAPVTSPGAAPAGEAAAPAADDEIVIEAWAHWEQGLSWINTALENSGFWAEHPNWRMNMVIAPFAEIHDKMLAAVSSGVGVPDIARVEQGRMSAFFKGDTVGFAPLNDLIGDRINELVPGAALDYWSWQGQIYGVGNETNACTLAYRKAVFDELDIPTPFETWQDMEEAGIMLKEATDMAIISFHDLSDGDFQMMLFNAGDQMFLEDGNFGGMTDLGRDILELQRRWIHDLEIAVVAPVTGDSTWSPPIYWEAVRQDQFASILGAPWHNGKLGRDDKIGPGQENEWRLQALPGGIGAGIPTATHGGTSVSIPLGAAHPEEAWAIIEESHLTPAVLQDVIERGIIPSWLPAIEDPLVQEPYDYYEGQVIGELYLELAKQMPRIYQSPWAPEFHTAIQNILITPILQDQADIDAAFDALTIELERVKSL